jgi:Family of unknown function (DUF5681)
MARRRMTRKKTARGPLAPAMDPAAPIVAVASVQSPPTISLTAPTAPTVGKQNKPWQFQPGQSGNASGRPVGARNKLAEDFLADMYRQYQESGPGILRDMATSPELKDRVRFIELVHDLLPRHAALDVSVQPVLPRPLAEMSDADWEIALGIRVRGKSE